MTRILELDIIGSLLVGLSNTEEMIKRFSTIKLLQSHKKQNREKILRKQISNKDPVRSILFFKYFKKII